jgi:DNA-3-methyladenine glycosylase I
MARRTTDTTDEKTRCGWVGNKPHFIPYHDEEWGVPVHDEHRHFEMLILEGAQAGLSWSTILLRREGYRKAFAGFDPAKVAQFDARKQAALLRNTGIIRNRLKIKSAISNAQAFLKVQDECGSFDAYIWQFVGDKSKINYWKDMSQVPATTPESDALSKDLKKRGFSFVGSTVIYAHMQAAGLVNDHTTDCFRHPSAGKSKSARNKLTNKVTSSLTQTKRSQKSRIRKGPNKNSRPLNIQLKRIYDSPSAGDGFRVLVDRLWPRGISKETVQLDLWLQDAGPSTALRKWFNHDGNRWKEFTRRYGDELNQQVEAVEKLRNIAQRGQLTLLYSASNQEWNNAVALKTYLEQPNS